MRFLDRIKQALTKFFYGRYGFDQLSIFLMILSIIVMYIQGIWYVSYILLGVAIFRAVSKNITRRRQEGDWFNRNIWYKVLGAWYKTKRYVDNRKIYKYFKCTKCKQKIRAPKGKGKIKVTCQNCKNTMVIKT